MPVMIDLDMPESCKECVFKWSRYVAYHQDEDICILTQAPCPSRGRPLGCPIKEVES